MLNVNRKIKRMASVIFGCFVLCFWVLSTSAKSDIELMQYTVEEDKINLFFKGINDIQGMTAQVARKEAEIEICVDELKCKTVILIDNSLSITPNNQEKIAAVLTKYAQEKPENEIVSIAVYGEEITYLLENETDCQKIIDALSHITYTNQDSYLTDILYEEISNLDSDEEYVRFIVATDGVDDKTIGYTKEELTECLKEKSYPIYSLGCVYKDNSVELENLFAISRLTNAAYFLLEDYEEPFDNIVLGLNEHIKKAILHVPEEYRDGSEKNVLISIEEKNDTTELSKKLIMPFQIEASVEVVESMQPEVIEEKEEIVVNEEPVAEEIVEEVVEEEKIDIVSVVAIIVIVIAIIVLILIVILGKKKEQKKQGKQKAENIAPIQNMMPETMVVQNLSVEIEKPDEEMTEILGSGYTDYKVILQDKNDSSKVFSYPVLDNAVIVGRSREAGAQIALSYNPSISKKHCKITIANGRYYVEDLGSANGTYINGERVNAKKEFASGSTLRLGQVEMIVFMESMD